MVHQCSGANGYVEVVKRQTTTDTLVTNLRLLMQEAKLGKDVLAKRSGVSERMIAYILSKERKPTIEIADSLAKPFGLNGWQLLIPNLPVELAKAGKISKLVENYAQASDTGREYIDHVAEKEAEYKKTTK